MLQLKAAISQIIDITDDEVAEFLKGCYLKRFKRNEYLSTPNSVCNKIHFINKGITRTVLVDRNGVEHTTNFSLENQFIADYASFLQKTPAIYYIQALEPTETVVIPRSVFEWGYQNLRQADRIGKFIAEFYFIFYDNQIKNQYFSTPKERYETITQVFPNIHNRVPQHMIASYLGITSVHLSRLKSIDLQKS